MCKSYVIDTCAQEKPESSVPQRGEMEDIGFKDRSKEEDKQVEVMVHELQDNAFCYHFIVFIFSRCC